MDYTFHCTEPLSGSIFILVKDEELYADAYQIGDALNITEVGILRMGGNVLPLRGGSYIKVTNLSNTLNKVVLSDLRGSDPEGLLKFAQENLQGLLEDSYLSKMGIATFAEQLPVELALLGKGTRPAIEGRTLYNLIKPSKPYMAWIKEEREAIQEDFELGVDYCNDEVGTWGELHGEKYFGLSLRMARHIAARATGPYGFNLREYLLACEENYSQGIGKVDEGQSSASLIQLKMEVIKEFHAVRQQDREELEVSKREMKGFVTESFRALQEAMDARLDHIVQDQNINNQGIVDIREHQTMMFSAILSKLTPVSHKKTSQGAKREKVSGEFISVSQAAKELKMGKRYDSPIVGLTAYMEKEGMIRDRGNRVWVACEGYKDKFVNGKLHRDLVESIRELRSPKIPTEAEIESEG